MLLIAIALIVMVPVSVFVLMLCCENGIIRAMHDL